MRVISGSRRGRKLRSFEGEFIRPTTDRVKESMFNLIQGECVGAVVYDAFSGSGALGIEAVSRGASFVVCTDSDRRSVAVTAENYKMCDFSKCCEILNCDAVEYLKKTDRHFDLVFLDPPYNKGLVTPVLELLYQRELLSPDGVIVVETDGPEDTFESSGFEVKKEKKYGRTVITVLCNSR